MSEKLKLDLVDGVAGVSVYLSDYRIAGPKPWGGGKVTRTWRVRRKDIEAALDTTPRND